MSASSFESDGRALAVFEVFPPKGRQRDARGLISRAIRSVLGKRYTLEPYFVTYEGAGKRGAFRGRYVAELTEVEAEACWLAIQVQASAEGWPATPCRWRYG